MKVNAVSLATLCALAFGLSSCGSSNRASHAPGSTTSATTIHRRSTTTVTTAPASPSPVDVVRAETEAFNRGDVSGAVAFFTSDAVLVTALGGCTPCLGRDTIRDHWSRAIASQTTVGFDHPTTRDGVVTARASLKSPSLPDGVTRAIGSLKVSIVDGKITRFEQTYDLTDPQTARLFAAVGLAPTTTTPQ